MTTPAAPPPLTAELHGEGPAREPMLRVVNRWTECEQFPVGHPDHDIEFYHRQLNEEANVLENAASSIVDFPDADWSIRKALARQCADEARHTLIYKRLVESRGGRIGQFPVMNFQYKILRKIPTLVGRLSVQNRTFEADGLDAVTYGIDQAKRAGDDELVAIYDAQQADEIRHVGFANDYLKREVRRDPRTALDIARGLDQGMRGWQEVVTGGGSYVSAYGVAREERKLAGFDDNEIAIAHDLAEKHREEARRKGK